MTDYTHTIQQCDVVNKSDLEIFRDKRLEWIHIFGGDDIHSISRQITLMLYSDISYRMAYRSRQFAVEHKTACSLNNELLARLLDHGWVTIQTFAIRRLLEKPANKPKLQINSLRRLCEEISDNRNLFTRENYVSHDGLPYDFEPVRKKFYEQLDYPLKGPIVYNVPINGPEGWGGAERRHRKFDELSKTNQNKRSRDDGICDEVFENILQLSNRSWYQDIFDLANKYLAHAADEYSRKQGSVVSPGISMDRVSDVHKRIVRLANFISATLLIDASSSFLPMPQFDQFELLDQTVINHDNINELRDHWKHRDDEISTWSEFNISDFT